MRKNILLIVAAIAAVLGLTMGGAAADRLLTGADIKNGTVSGADIKNDSLSLKDMTPLTANQILNNRGPRGYEGKQGKVGNQGPRGFQGDQGQQGIKGDPGERGASGLDGAYYALAQYNAGDTNAGAIATVACDSEADIALSGGVQMIGVGGDNSAVGSSFPGRMDWSTNTPKPDRLDGWIVQFDAGHAPKTVTVWALCVRNTGAITTRVTYNQVS